MFYRLVKSVSLLPSFLLFGIYAVFPKGCSADTEYSAQQTLKNLYIFFLLYLQYMNRFNHSLFMYCEYITFIYNTLRIRAAIFRLLNSVLFTFSSNIVRAVFDEGAK
jgi:hypothetical protein